MAATSVNLVDYKIRQGVVRDIAPHFPAILHGDVAGIIEAVDEGGDRLPFTIRRTLFSRRRTS